MNVLIVGATGNIGQHTIKYALKEGHIVTAFGRSVEKIKLKHKNLILFKGDVLNEKQVAKSMKNQEVVILTFGAPLNKKTIFSVPNLCKNGTQIVIEKMYMIKVNRLICMTAIGAGDSKGHGRFIFRNVVEPLLLGRIMEDRTNQEEVVKNSALNEWVIVRPTELNDDESQEIRIIKNLDREKEPETIAREDVGRLLVDLVQHKEYDHTTILITN